MPTLKQKLFSDPQYFGDWGDDMKDLIMASSEDPEHYIKPTPLYMLPIGHTWTSKTGMTLIGDAAHLMTPFAREGMNAAILDALGLAEEIIKEMRMKVESADATKQSDQSDKLGGD
jgi:2-polyprenyl-6-methoxyphenol hydroxylase-like FAD-dependent oxidoreductase